MSSKDKAEQLVKRMYAVHSNSASDITFYFAKESALICVDEIRDNLPLISEIQDYWTEVKIEIISL